VDASRSALAAFVGRHRPVLVAAGILVLSVVMFALDLTGVWGPTLRPFGASAWWGLLTVVPGCALVTAYRRRPLLALALGTVLFVVDAAWFGTVGMLFVLNELIYSATMSLSPRGRHRMLVVLVAVSVGLVAVVAVASDDPRLAVLVALLAFAFFGSPFWWATAVRSAQEVAELHAGRAEDALRLAELREREVVRAERERMARELHDVIAGHLSAVALRSEAALAREPDERRDRDALAAIRQSSLRSLDEMRAQILLLRSGEPDEPVAAADRLDRVAEIAETIGIRVALEVRDVPELPTAIDQAAARIVREALVNAGKHSGGAEVAVTIGAADGELQLEVRSRGGVSRGVGGAGLGLVTMRERAEALGGTFAAGPAPDGWRVSARLPLRVSA